MSGARNRRDGVWEERAEEVSGPSRRLCRGFRHSGDTQQPEGWHGRGQQRTPGRGGLPTGRPWCPLYSFSAQQPYEDRSLPCRTPQHQPRPVFLLVMAGFPSSCLQPGWSVCLSQELAILVRSVSSSLRCWGDSPPSLGWPLALQLPHLEVMPPAPSVADQAFLSSTTQTTVQA